MEIEITRSARRRKTVQARLFDGVLHIAMPDHLSEEGEKHWVDVMVKRIERRVSTDSIDLETRARDLAEDLDLAVPASITWSERQKTLWGSCTPANRYIRVSSRLASCPHWVLDYVIVHELAHLTHDGHSKAFWSLVNRYPLAERARGYLAAKGPAQP